MENQLLENVNVEPNYKPENNVTDKINGEYKQWKTGDIVLINAGTNTGKSYFVRETLYEQAKREGSRILFVFNRRNLKQQNLEQIKGKEDVITTINYQAIESVELHGDSFNFAPFKYLVCDESHYFTTDSEFNKFSDLSFNAIARANKCIRVYMTATGGTIFKYIKYLINDLNKNKFNIWEYKIKQDTSRIKALAFYKEEEVLETFFDTYLKPDDKVIYFCRKTERAFDLSQKYKDSLFVCSDATNNSYKKELDKEAIDKMIKDKKSHHKFLFTTTTLDNGVEFLDDTIKYIVCDVSDFDVLMQCIGRKRFDTNNPNDKVSVIVHDIGNKSLNGIRRSKKRVIEEVEFFKKEGVRKWTEKYDRFSNAKFCIYDTGTEKKYDSHKKINEVKYFKIKCDYDLIDDILSQEKRNKEYLESLKAEERVKILDHGSGYLRYVWNLIGTEGYTMFDDIYRKMDLSDHLEMLIGKKFYKDEQKQIIALLNVRQDGKQMRSIKTLNGSLNEQGINYQIKPKVDYNRKLEDGSKNKKYKKTYWSIEKVTGETVSE